MYPKVLIIGQSFNSYSGGGITLSNLFRGWDKDRLALAAEQLVDLDLTICKNYYQLGFKENERRFPFNLIQKKYNSGEIDLCLIDQNTNAIKVKTPNNKKFPSLVKIYDNVLNYIGLYHYSKKIDLSEEFLLWINEYKPDIIYTQLASFELIRFLDKINIKTKIPFAIHIMDDWPSTISKKGILQKYWNSRINKEFKLLLNKATVLMCISESMSFEYKRRYNKNFSAFHNPIDIEKWKTNIERDYSIGKEVTILYTGRIGLGIDQSLRTVSNVISEYNKKHKAKIELILQTKIVPEWTKKYDFITCRFISDYSNYPSSLINADILLLPYDFTEESIRFIKYSMPTKASEYMASGTPILTFAPKETALCQHAIKYGWAYVVSENSSAELTNAFECLIDNQNIRKNFGIKAKEFSINYYDRNKIVKKFKNILAN